MRLVIFGAGELAEICYHYFTQYSEHRVEGFLVDEAYHSRTYLLDLPVLTTADAFKRWPPNTHGMFVAVGYSGGNLHRQTKCHEMRAHGYQLASFVHPTAVADGHSMGDNCLVSENAVVQPYSRLGEGVLVRAGSIVGHHSIIGNHCYIAPGVTMCGGCVVGHRVFLGAGALMREQVNVTDDVVIGMGGVVTKSIDKVGIYVGSPATLVHRDSKPPAS